MTIIANQLQPIEQITRYALSTEEAAHYLNRRPQTLRVWAMHENGLIRPLRINGRLAWPVKEIKKVLGMEV
ncbi:MAG: DNA-binding protein [Nitrosomonas sp.]|nr:DNA-binding protein [Nitrosomonas sp.]